MALLQNSIVYVVWTQSNFDYKVIISWSRVRTKGFSVTRTVRDWKNLPHNVVEIEDDAKFRKLLLFTIL